MSKKRVFAYYDGSNFYHFLKNNYRLTNIHFHLITNQLINPEKEGLVKIKYFNSPVNQQENPKAYSSQQKFFQKLKQTPLLELSLGRLVSRPLNKINVDCPSGCGHQKADSVKCPQCNNEININKCYKSLEKGVDVKIATEMLLDALDDKYDVALLFSGDADFCPAIKHIVNKLKKEVIFCHFPYPKTNELRQTCSSSRMITEEMVKKSKISDKNMTHKAPKKLAGILKGPKSARDLIDDSRRDISKFD